MNVTASESAEPARAPERSAADTRRRLLASGTQLFASKGLQKTTTVDIARGAGVAAGTYYLHFKDKHELFREIVLAAFDDLRERLRHAGSHAGADPVAVVRARMQELLAFAEENRAVVSVLFGRDHGAEGLAEEVFDLNVPAIEAGLRRRLGAQTTLDPVVTAQALAASWARVVAWWVEDPDRAPRERVVDTLVELHPFSRRPEHG